MTKDVPSEDCTKVSRQFWLAGTIWYGLQRDDSTS